MVGMRTLDDYAGTLSGVILHALDMHAWAVTMYDRTTDEGDRMLCAGMARAYDTTVRLATGRAASDPVARDVAQTL